MPEVRYNLITGDWVIIATERAKRPEDFTRKTVMATPPEFVASCPFCPGNEAKTPDEALRIMGADGKWAVRSVPNKFSALTPQGDVTRSGSGLKAIVSGVGLHEVIIETPMHNKTTALLPLSQVEHIIKAYKDRFMAFYRDSRVQHVIVFKNHGESAGTSLEHPHSQIVGTPVFPGQVRSRIEESLRYYGDYSKCLCCWEMREELEEGSRIVAQNSSFVAFIPYAALSPFHIWIFPRKHSACFGCISDSELADLALLLKEILQRIYIGLENPDFNYVIRSLSPQDKDVKYFHWYVALVPRVNKTAGFELGTGMYINTALPEKSAQFLRNVELPKDR